MNGFFQHLLRLVRARSSRSERRALREERQERKYQAALAKRRAAWEARAAKTAEPAVRFSPFSIRRRWLRMRVGGFYRRIPVPVLLAVYLLPLIGLSYYVGTTVLAGQPQVKTVPREVTPPDPEESLRNLIKETTQLVIQKDTVRARKNLEELQARVPDHPGLDGLFGAVELTEKNYEAARRHYERAVERSPRVFVARYNLAEIAFLMKNHAEAEERFLDVLKSAPRNETILWRLILICLAQGKTEEADRHYAKLTRNGKTPAWHYATAVRLLRENQVKDADKMREQARLFYGDDVEGYDATLRQMGYLP